MEPLLAGLKAAGIASCLNAGTGEVLVRKRLGNGGTGLFMLPVLGLSAATLVDILLYEDPPR